ncbi:Phosphate starvation-inducible protein [Alteracholeplasma palmae J233]|uniref:PhoH-like protein n=1 Tax=Alteracholeplasma palmae (strain ATCC 49389 / J233) TaxID=1318466 RepID=U4KPI6_ALTPJ|nr:PhoH family protein [Alteracholeplasma palmae]CCV64160.1 Phosphate starvation-inducible protein [Alteracholeplasma palmae J233]
MKLDVKIKHPETLNLLVGMHDKNLAVFKEYLDIRVSILNDEIIVDSDPATKPFLTEIFKVLIELAENKVALTERDILYIIKVAEKEQLEHIIDLYKNQKKILISDQGKAIYPKTFNQKIYSKALEKYPLVFGVGPAGTGKTYLAVAHAVAQLKEGKVRKLILTRPAVEAGESLGFLPGDLKEKVDPYLIPLYDALYEMLGKYQTDQLLEKNVIEIAPLAYMRGRTLENAFVILDEAQNTTSTQMKMFLTRLGFSSKMVVCGDPSQTDLPKGKESGLKDALKHLENIDEIKIVTFDKLDVIRHPLVQKILERYENS